MPQNQEEIQVHEATVNFESEAEYGYGIYNLAKRVVSNTVNQTKKNIHHLPFYFDDDKDPAIDSVIDFKSNVSLFKASVNNDDIYLRTHFERVLKHYPALSTVVEYCGSDEFPYTTRNKLVEYIYDHTDEEIKANVRSLLSIDDEGYETGLILMARHEIDSHHFDLFVTLVKYITLKERPLGEESIGLALFKNILAVRSNIRDLSAHVSHVNAIELCTLAKCSFGSGMIKQKWRVIDKLTNALGKDFMLSSGGYKLINANNLGSFQIIRSLDKDSIHPPVENITLDELNIRRNKALNEYIDGKYGSLSLMKEAVKYIPKDILEISGVEVPFMIDGKARRGKALYAGVDMDVFNSKMARNSISGAKRSADTSMQEMMQVNQKIQYMKDLLELNYFVGFLTSKGRMLESLDLDTGPMVSMARTKINDFLMLFSLADYLGKDRSDFDHYDFNVSTEENIKRLDLTPKAISKIYLGALRKQVKESKFLSEILDPRYIYNFVDVSKLDINAYRNNFLLAGEYIPGTKHVHEHLHQLKSFVQLFECARFITKQCTFKLTEDYVNDHWYKATSCAHGPISVWLGQYKKWQEGYTWYELDDKKILVHHHSVIEEYLTRISNATKGNIEDSLFFELLPENASVHPKDFFNNIIEDVALEKVRALLASCNGNENFPELPDALKPLLTMPGWKHISNIYELVNEGDMMHHCIGDGYYTNALALGESIAFHFGIEGEHQREGVTVYIERRYGRHVKYETYKDHFTIVEDGDMQSYEVDEVYGFENRRAMEYEWDVITAILKQLGKESCDNTKDKK